jgi:hypothetical protein
VHFRKFSAGLNHISVKTPHLLTILLAIAAPIYAQMEQSSSSASIPKDTLTTTNAPTRLSPMSDTGDLASTLFVEDRITLEFMTGVMFSPCGLGPSAPVFNYQQNNIRLGWMLVSPDDKENPFRDTPFRGNFEALFEVTGSYIWESFGTYMTGITGIVRYNFVQPNWIVVPYIQGGAGVIYTNARNWSNQEAIGGNWEFTPQFGAGLKFLIDDNFSFNIEGAFQHISNANTSARNEGVNAYGGFAGFTYYFDDLWLQDGKH